MDPDTALTPPGRPTQADAPGTAPDAPDAPDAGARLAAWTGTALLVLLGLVGLTLTDVHAHLVPHLLLGLCLVPPVLLKVAVTARRALRYYRGDPDFRRAGPPRPLLRVLAVPVVLSMAAVLVTGVAVPLVPDGLRPPVERLHALLTLGWFAVTSLHVLLHLAGTVRLVGADLHSWPGGGAVARGALLRPGAVAAAVLLGVLVAVVALSPVRAWVYG